jgi:hypothetical protein
LKAFRDIIPEALKKEIKSRKVSKEQWNSFIHDGLIMKELVKIQKHEKFVLFVNDLDINEEFDFLK